MKHIHKGHSAPEIEKINDGADTDSAIARGDLYKLSNHAQQLFNDIQNMEHIEPWVITKISKAAEYISSVYHYIENEVKLNDYGHRIENSDMISESVKQKMLKKLKEAKQQASEINRIRANQLKEAEAFRTKYFVDGNGKPFVIISQGDGSLSILGRAGQVYTTLPSGAHEISEDEFHQMMDNWRREASIQNRYAKPAKKYDARDQQDHALPILEYEKEGAVRYFLRKDGSGFTATPVGDSKWEIFDAKTHKEVIRDRIPAEATQVDSEEYVKAVRKQHNIDEGKKPSEGLSAKKKSEIVKSAKAGKDIGKPGKNFKKVAANAAKEYGSKEAGERVAAAAMWKNVKEKALKESKSTDSNLPADELRAISKIPNIDQMREKAIELIANSKNTDHSKIEYLVRQLSSASSTKSIIQILYNAYLKGSGLGVINSKYFKEATYSNTPADFEFMYDTRYDQNHSDLEIRVVDYIDRPADSGADNPDDYYGGIEYEFSIFDPETKEEISKDDIDPRDLRMIEEKIVEKEDDEDDYYESYIPSAVFDDVSVDRIVTLSKKQ